MERYRCGDAWSPASARSRRWCGGHVATERLPSVLRMVDHVRPCVHRVTEEVRAVVTGVGVPPQVLRERVERRRREAFLINIRERSRSAGIADAEQIEVVRMLPEVRERRNRV